MAFISSAKRSNKNEDGNTAYVPTASTNVPTASASVVTISQDTGCAYIAFQSSGSQIKFEDINQIDEDDMEEMNIKWNMALLNMRADKFWKKTGKKISIQGSDVGSKAEEQAPKALMAIDGVGWDWSYMANDEEDHALVADEVAPIEFALMANISAESKVFDNSLCSKGCKKNNDSLNSKITDLTDKLFDAKNLIYHYKLALAQVESRLVEYKERDVKYCEKIRTLEFMNESNNECIEILKNKLETLKEEKEGVDGKLAGLLTASKDLDNLIESQRSDKNKDGLGYSAIPHPFAQLYLSPKKDLSWTGLPECADDTVTDYSRPSPTVESKTESLKKPPVKYAEQYRKPNKKPNVRGNQRNWNNLKSHQLGPDFVMKKKACFNCGDFNHLAYDYRKGSYPPVNIKFSTRSRNFPTANRTLPTSSRKFPTGSTKCSTADMGMKGKAGSSQNNIDDKGYWDSGCSRHMTGNISYLFDYEPFDGGYVSFGQGGCKITGKGTIKTGKLEFENVYFVKDLKYNLFSVSQICDKKNSVLFTDSECIVLGRDFKLLDDANILVRTPRQHNMYSIDLNNIIPHRDLTCLVFKASADECILWHMRLGHLNFKTMNKFVRHNLVRGLPTKCFENDHTCTACLKGKQHKASCKSILVNFVTKPLHTLHMDLFGPTFVSSISHKWYCLVVTDDFSRFTWTFFLKSKDETSGILKKFITEIENLKDLKVKIIRYDNGGEFRNKEMNDFCSQKGIKRVFSNARTPLQNGVPKRRNRTLIEAARTMLADAKLPVTFWAEVVNTAYYVQNRVLVNKSHNKTPYELFNGRSPAIEFLKPFGCHVMILNTLNNLGKFKEKGDEGYFIGYSISSKAFRVFNKRTKRVEENLHVEFLENKAIEKGVGPNWLFDIDSLTKSMNYVSVDVGTISTATMVTPYSKRKGKEVMVESAAPKKQKVQEQIDAQVARELEEQLERGSKKTSEVVTKEAKTPDKVPEEKVKEMMQLIPIEEVYVEALQVKHPIIDWKHLDREDLNQLWRLVKETLSNTPPTSKKEMELWVELNRLLYDTCGVHHVTAKDKEIFMLVEKDYPLRKALALVMICYKLQVENYSQMVNDLVLKIYKIASTPRQQGD
nr:putative ribonuclease H-like domain-containing protein [Tanacetum cinerariifolium]